MTLLDDLVDGRAGARQRVLDAVVAAEQRVERDDLLDALAALAARGDDRATQILIEATIRLRLADRPIRRVLLDPADVDDAIQNTLVAIAEKIRSFEQRAKFTTWLHTVARNEALMVLRRKKPSEQLEADSEPPPGFVARLSSVVANQARVHAAIAALPPDQRTVIELRELQGVDYEEIARRLDVPIGTVRSRLNRARAALADLLVDWET